MVLLCSVAKNRQAVGFHRNRMFDEWRKRGQIKALSPGLLTRDRLMTTPLINKLSGVIIEHEASDTEGIPRR